MNSPKIIWQKWQDELVREFDSAVEPDDDTDAEDGIDDDEEEQNFDNIKKQTIVVTPMGILPYNDANICLKNFNLWLAHTNFTINQHVSNIIESIDGVETLDIFTRYRFRIAVGKAFSDSLVMRNINEHLYEYINEYTN